MAVFRIVLLLGLACNLSLGQTANRYVVYFKDKSGTTFSISKPEEFLSERAIERRGKQKIQITEEDFPVNPSYLAEVKGTGAKTFFSSRWMNCVLIESTPAILSTVQNLPHVLKTELAAPGKKLIGGRKKQLKRKKEYVGATATRTQLEMIGIDAMQNDGFKGSGISIAVFDSGFEGVNTALPFQHLYQKPQIKQTFDFISNSGNVYQFDDHGTEVFSVMAAFANGSFTGGAYEANYSLFVTEDAASEYRIEEFNWLFAAEQADSAGVDIINASLGYNEFDDPSMDYKTTDLNGSTAIVTKAASKAIAKGMLVVCSAGNEGSNSWKLVTPPADAVGILATGSVDEFKIRSSFSSIGPTTDGRPKPDIVALGSGTSIIKPSGSISTNNGTSMASPLIASLAAGLWQAYPWLTVGELYKVIIESADQAIAPDNLKGYGLPNYQAVKNYLEIASMEEDIMIFPNPATDTIRIAFRQPLNESVTITVYDQPGRVLQEDVLEITWLSNPVEYDLSALSPGIYFVKIKTADQFKTIRLVKL